MRRPGLVLPAAVARCLSSSVDLAAWVDRNARYGQQLAAALEENGIVTELAASNRIAQWAYAQTEAAKGYTWLRADQMVPLSPQWRELLDDGDHTGAICR